MGRKWKETIWNIFRNETLERANKDSQEDKSMHKKAIHGQAGLSITPEQSAVYPAACWTKNTIYVPETRMAL